ncbi:hypothetical protein DFJ43DRAFT_1155965 [Lentinula guzmanii]|uniref:Uncharacterized protein n=1 Tax=Lentinula guzmanii TaxID=2804957 RepID=A0AA38JG25_9AGAR|nr:hypothetical protein DFJ43DRAFT_1158116 [Lentinula guzmanii]KAJ3731142.1 hypothetical protein DFJ43DRAFT_1155965 [Lentinula guzmanii]
MTELRIGFQLDFWYAKPWDFGLDLNWASDLSIYSTFTYDSSFCVHRFLGIITSTSRLNRLAQSRCPIVGSKASIIPRVSFLKVQPLFTGSPPYRIFPFPLLIVSFLFAVCASEISGPYEFREESTCCPPIGYIVIIAMEHS